MLSKMRVVVRVANPQFRLKRGERKVIYEDSHHCEQLLEEFPRVPFSFNFGNGQISAGRYNRTTDVKPLTR